MILCLIRHANNPAPVPGSLDPDLSELGVQQAHQLGRRLASCGIQAVYASSLRRALRTAQILAEYVPAPLRVRASK